MPTATTRSSATRYLVEEARTAGVPMAERTAWRICTDDRVERDFTPDAPNTLWLSNITERWTREGKFYLVRSRTSSPTGSWERPQPNPRRDNRAGGYG
jgi:transposase InsO family protein